MAKQKTIHFICTGNTYRSRLAEAIFNSKAPPIWKATSSGIEARDNENGPITWYAERLIKNHNLIKHMSFSWTITSAEILKKADHVVFLTPIHEVFAKNNLGFKKENYDTWDIPDLWEVTPSLSDDLASIQASEKTFLQIEKKVDELIKKLAY